MTQTVDAPARVDDLQLIGEMVGTGYRTPPALVRRSDGQILQLTPLLYRILEAVDGRRGCSEIATVVSRATGRAVSADMVAMLIDEHLRALGLLKLADGSEHAVKRSDPLLGLKFRIAVTDPRGTRRLTDPFRVLFRPAPAAAVVLGFLAVTWWVFFDQGLAAAAYDAFQRPQLLLLVFVVTVLSGGFHEFGHAAAARYSGADPGVIGAGVYLVWPAFYTDVTDSYRLGRAGRIRTDLGGLYFNALVVVLTFIWWYSTGWDALLLLVATQILQMVQQLLPLLRFDGYHLLADLVGVPDLYHRIWPTILGMLPHRWLRPENRVLKPWARVVITLWVLVTIPMMALMLFALVTAMPRLVGTANAVLRDDAAGMADAWQSGELLDISAHGVQVLSLVLPLIAGVLILARLGLRSSRGLAGWSRGSVLRRLAAATLSTLVITGLCWAWWPQPGAYRPIDPGEKGLLSAVLPGDRTSPVAAVTRTSSQDAEVRPIGSSAERRLASQAPLQATFPRGGAVPSKADPQLAVVLVPSDGRDDAPDDAPDADSAGTPAQDPTWVFPFDKPLPPAEGDNQAGAYNTTDGSMKYDVAFALVWATGDEVLNVNEAHAYASCSNCVTVAVAFQVVLIMDDAQVVIPQNLAVAANYDCYRCITAAIASQLVLSVQATPGEEQLLALAEVWNRLTEFGKGITKLSLSEISAQLDVFKGEITEILLAAPPVASGATPLPTPNPTPSPTGNPTDESSDAPPPTAPPTSTSTLRPPLRPPAPQVQARRRPRNRRPKRQPIPRQPPRHPSARRPHRRRSATDSSVEVQRLRSALARHLEARCGHRSKEADLWARWNW